MNKKEFEKKWNKSKREVKVIYIDNGSKDKATVYADSYIYEWFSNGLRLIYAFRDENLIAEIPLKNICFVI